MLTVVGVFQTPASAYEAVDKLKSIRIKKEKINLLVPGDPEKAVKEIPTTEAEQPGMGAAVGGVVGGAFGAAAGVSLGGAAASVLLPGVGPIIAVGILGAAILGAISAAGGAAAGDALEKSLDQGLPIDEIYVYEDALRQGRSIVAVLAENDEQADAAREVLERTGAESIDAAREKWWIGLRDAEQESYTAQGVDFTKDEVNYRRGFEAAQDPRLRGKSYQESDTYLVARYPKVYREESFRRGYERGQAHRHKERADRVSRQ